jgi:hypothetical protein
MQIKDRMYPYISIYVGTTNKEKRLKFFIRTYFRKKILSFQPKNNFFKEDNSKIYSIWRL